MANTPASFFWRSAKVLKKPKQQGSWKTLGPEAASIQCRIFIPLFLFHTRRGPEADAPRIRFVLSADRNSSTMTCVNGYVRLIDACLKCVHLGWVAVSASLVSCFSCLRSCLPSCLAFRRREPVRLLPDHLPNGWLLVEFWGGVHTWPNTQEWFRASVCFCNIGNIGSRKNKKQRGNCVMFLVKSFEKSVSWSIVFAVGAGGLPKPLNSSCGRGRAASHFVVWSTSRRIPMVARKRNLMVKTAALFKKQTNNSGWCFTQLLN